MRLGVYGAKRKLQTSHDIMVIKNKIMKQTAPLTKYMVIVSQYNSMAIEVLAESDDQAVEIVEDMLKDDPTDFVFNTCDDQLEVSDVYESND